MTDDAQLAPFSKYLADLPRAANEAQKRHLFSTLVASAYGETEFATDLALGAEYQVRFRESGLLRRGAIDSFYGNLVIEFENSLKATGKHAIEQLRAYVAGAWLEEDSTDRPFLAVATDGAVWEVLVPTPISPKDPIAVENVRFEASETWAPRGEGDAESLRDFLNRLFFRRTLLSPTAVNFARDFGLSSPAFLGASGELRQKLGELEGDSQLEVLRDAWADSLQVAYGHIDADEQLFVKHTYLAVLARLLVWAALERRHLERDDLEDVLTGRYFAARHVENLADEDFFAWWRISSDSDAHRVWIGLSRHLAGYDLEHVGEDILKPLYEQLVDPDTRHDLGEYYTPDWLATMVTNHMLEAWNWSSGPPAMLDPTCGSGTFLRVAIDQLRERLEPSADDELLHTILASVTGMDVHPLAVVVAKATYLLAIKDLISHATKSVTLPVFLANSLRTPRVIHTASLFGDRAFLRVGEREFPVPPDFLSRGRDYDAAIGSVIEVAQAYGRAKSSFADIPASLAATLGTLLNGYEEKDELQAVLASMAEYIARLIKGRRDSIHGYLLRNHYRPAMLRNSFDLIVGNPPWLTVADIRAPEYKELVVRLAKEAAIAPRSAREQAHTELATIFLWHAATEFLRPVQEDTDTPRVALVMPRSVMTATHHRLLREGKYSGRFRVAELWDLDGVSPLFNVPACVVFVAQSVPRPGLSMRGRTLTGRLGTEKDIPLSIASSKLTTTNSEFGLVYLAKRSAWRETEEEGDPVAARSSSASTNAYTAAFRQGAVIYPQTLFVVTPQFPVDRSATTVRIRTDETAAIAAKLLKSCRVNAVVEVLSLYSTVATDHLLPYHADAGWTVVLPTVCDPGTPSFEPVNADSLRRAGRIGTAEWLDWAEVEWASARKVGEKKTLVERLDHLGHFSAQSTMKRHLVLYTSAGSRPVAAYLDTGQLPLPYVARDQTYWASFSEPGPARYLAAFLNSDLVMEAIRDWMTRGLFGPRHIHKRALDVPLPTFDPDKETHQLLAGLGERLETQAASLMRGAPETTIGRRRSWLRENLDSNLLAQVEETSAIVSLGARGR